MKSSKLDSNYRVRNAKLKKLKQRTLATDYLSNISLSGNCDQDSKKVYFDKIISNQFDCFLSFNKISHLASKQNEYFNYYKEKLCAENPNSTRTVDFLCSEFSNNNFSPANAYIERLLCKTKPYPAHIPSITIVPSMSFYNSSDLNKKASMSDAESEYIKSRINQETTSKNATSNMTISSSSSISTQLSNSHKLTTSFNAAFHSAKSKLSQKLSKSPIEASVATLNESNKTLECSMGSQNSASISVTKAISSNRKFQRTISESSSESFNPLNPNFNCNKPYMSYKPTLFNNLKRLTNEKMLLTSSGSPIGIFSRLPFRTETNESFMSKSRHMSLNKTQNTQNNFILDVFELLDLDFDEYVNSVRNFLDINEQYLDFNL